MGGLRKQKQAQSDAKSVELLAVMMKVREIAAKHKQVRLELSGVQQGDL